MPPERPLDRARTALDGALCGQQDAKTGLMLAWIAREHALLEGAPGCGKSALARALGPALGADSLGFALHRDARTEELLGEAALRRERRPGGVERLRLVHGSGPLEGARLLLLEDLSRAPGEALGALLPLLSQRRLAGHALPLETAIATCGPPELELYADPLEPSQMDRFAIQIRMRGLVLSRQLECARAVLDWTPTRPPPPLTSAERASVQRRAAELPLGPDVRSALLAAIARLRAAAGDDDALLSDRSFARAAPRILRAHALLRGAERVEPADVRALRYMLARRIPEALQPHVDALIEEALHEGEPPTAPRAVRQTRRATSPGSGTSAEARPAPDAERVHAALEGVAPRARARGADDAASVEALVRALEGRLERGAAARGDDPGGVPRGWRRLRRFDELLDADPLDALLLCEASAAPDVRVQRRERRNAGGALAVLRDVSASMEGRFSRWAGSVVAGLVRTAARRRMRVGYVEFNHEAERFASAGQFFHRRYRRLLALAARRRAEGRTSYEAPLRVALEEFRRTPSRTRHLILLTDGVPVLGDPQVRRERDRARELGVQVHTVFLGVGPCPPVLDALSLESGGLRFAARVRPDGRIALRARTAPLPRSPAFSGEAARGTPGAPTPDAS